VSLYDYTELVLCLYINSSGGVAMTRKDGSALVLARVRAASSSVSLYDYIELVLCLYTTRSMSLYDYGVASISRMLKNTGLFCKRALQKRPIFLKETYIFKHPINRSHPIVLLLYCPGQGCL